MEGRPEQSYFIPTKKNQLVSDLYETLGFTRTDSPKNRENEIHYVADTKNIKQKNQSKKALN